MEFPAVGYRDYDSSGTLYGAGTIGYYWSSVAGSSGSAYSLWFNSGLVDPQANWDKRSGYSVRCVR